MWLRQTPASPPCSLANTISYALRATEEQIEEVANGRWRLKLGETESRDTLESHDTGTCECRGLTDRINGTREMRKYFAEGLQWGGMSNRGGVHASGITAQAN